MFWLFSSEYSLEKGLMKLIEVTNQLEISSCQEICEAIKSNNIESLKTELFKRVKIIFAWRHKEITHGIYWITRKHYGDLTLVWQEIFDRILFQIQTVDTEILGSNFKFLVFFPILNFLINFFFFFAPNVDFLSAQRLFSFSGLFSLLHVNIILPFLHNYYFLLFILFTFV